MPVVQLTNPNRVTTPSWLTDTSAANSLREYQAALPSLFDSGRLENAMNAYRDTSMARYERGVDAQARAAVNRGAQQGRQVGASFAKGQLMQGAMNEGNRMNAETARLVAQMMAQRAGAQGQAAGQLADFGLAQQGMRSGFVQAQQGMGLQAAQGNQRDALARFELAQRLAQQNADREQQNRQYYSGLEQDKYQFGQNYNLQSRSQQQQAALQALRQLGPGGFNYNMAGGMPMSLNDAAQYGRAQQYERQRQSLIGQISGGGSEMQGPLLDGGGNRNFTNLDAAARWKNSPARTGLY